jgi:catabolite regulation protein CreA
VVLELTTSFTSRAEFVYTLSGIGTEEVNLGTVTTGARIVVVEVDATTDPAHRPVTVYVNDATDGGIEVSPGGFFVLGSPAPVNGVTALLLDHITAATVRVRVLG